ncbi:MAG: hypothetical protein CMM30_03445 [Rhodospirillaceae bacterium]|nr:hypothetical protein [Rhodospirillaceae bacterium]
MVFFSVSDGLSIYFAIAGAWPIIGFFCLDFALVILAFKINYWTGKN